jgi:hypothetical protein
MALDSGQQSQAVQIANAVLEGKTSILEAAPKLCSLLLSNPEIASREDCNLFNGIASETDDLPIGRVREEWHPDFLPEKDREIARCEALWRDDAMEACERIIVRAQRGAKQP